MLRRGFDRGGQDSGQPEEMNLERLQEADNLMLDDVWIRSGEKGDWPREILSEVLRYREGRCKPTILTTNYSGLDEIETMVEARIASRLRQQTVIVLEGRDWRMSGGPTQRRQMCVDAAQVTEVE